MCSVLYASEACNWHYVYDLCLGDVAEAAMISMYLQPNVCSRRVCSGSITLVKPSSAIELGEVPLQPYPECMLGELSAASGPLHCHNSSSSCVCQQRGPMHLGCRV